MQTPLHHSSDRLAAPLLLMAVALWSGNFVVGRAIGNDVSALGLNLARWVVAMVILLPFVASECRAHIKELARSWKYLALLGLTGVAGFHLFVYKALEHTEAANALLMLSTAPALILILSAATGGDNLSPRQWGGIAVSCVGALVLITRGDLEMILGLRFGPGEMWMLAAVPTWAIYSVLLKHRPHALPQRATLGASTVFGLLWMTPLVLLFPGSATIEWTAEVAASIAYIAIGASVIAFLSWNRGVAIIGPARAGVFLHLMPLFGAILAWVYLGERLHGYHLAGAALTLFGIAITQRFGRRSNTEWNATSVVSVHRGR